MSEKIRIITPEEADSRYLKPDSPISEVQLPARLSPDQLNATIETEVALTVPPVVIATLSDDPSVAQEAANLAQSDAGLVRGSTPVTASGQPAVSVPFLDGTRNALEVDEWGKPTPLSAELHVEAEWPLVEPKVLDLIQNSAASWYPAVAAGDSTTEGADLEDRTNDRWTTLLSQRIGQTITNRGYSGARTEEIVALRGGLTVSGTPTGGVMPASGNITVLDLDINPFRSAGPTVPAIALCDDGTIIPGTFKAGAVFTRTTSGPAVPTGRVQIRMIPAEESRLLFLGAGVNNEPLIEAETQTVDQVKAWYRALTSRWHGPMVIWGLLDRGYYEAPGTVKGDYIAEMERWLAVEYGDAYAPFRQYLASSQSFADALLIDSTFTATSGDEQDLSAGTVPRSFRANTGVHLNPLGHQLQARFFHRHMILRGLI